MAEAIRPFARALFLCDYAVGYEDGKTDLYGLFNAIRPSTYPHTQARFCVFAQLVGGFGDVAFYVDVIFRPGNELVWTTEVRHLRFHDREVVVQMALEIQGCLFRQPGSYLLELYCDGACVADVPLLLLPGDENSEAEEAEGEP